VKAQEDEAWDPKSWTPICKISLRTGRVGGLCRKDTFEEEEANWSPATSQVRDLLKRRFAARGEESMTSV
jgi:hypothetical protein